MTIEEIHYGNLIRYSDDTDAEAMDTDLFWEILGKNSREI